MKRLWAPWRTEYLIKISKEKLQKDFVSEACVFCERPKLKPSVKSLVLHKGKKAFVILNRYPYTNGHLMVIPYRHLSDYTKLTQAEHTEMGILISRCIKALKKVYGPEGFNVGMNIGEAAGAGIKDHLHYHIMPRWIGDHNFTATIGKTRLIMEELETSYKKIKKVF